MRWYRTLTTFDKKNLQDQGHQILLKQGNQQAGSSSTKTSTYAAINIYPNSHQLVKYYLHIVRLISLASSSYHKHYHWLLN